MKRTISLILVYSLCLLMMACPKDTAIRKAAKASFELSGLTVDAIAATAKAYNENLIGLDMKDKIAVPLKVIAVGGKKFNEALQRFYAESGENIPADKIGILKLIFSTELVAPLLEILQALKVVSADRAAYLLSAINALQAVILIISNGFSSLKAEVSMSGVQVYA